MVEGTTEPGKRSLSEFIKYQGNIAGTGSVSRAGALVPLITTDKKPGAKGGGGEGGGRPDLPETLLQITERGPESLGPEVLKTDLGVMNDDFPNYCNYFMCWYFWNIGFLNGFLCL